jgi:hypothetical protein
VKIGVARSPRQRLATLQTGSAAPLSLIGAVVGGPAQEKELHARFRRYHVPGRPVPLTGGLTPRRSRLSYLLLSSSGGRALSPGLTSTVSWDAAGEP